MKIYLYLYYISTGLLTLLMLFSVGNYFFQTETIAGLFDGFGYPSYLIYPLAIAKLLGLLVLWFVKGKAITEWAYAGFFFNVVLAFFAHYMIGDGQHYGALLALVCLLGSYYAYKKWF